MATNPIPPLNIELYKKRKPWAIVFSIIVLIIVVSLRKLHIDTDYNFKWLAAFHSTLNALTAIGLLIAYYYIKMVKDISKHKTWMITNMIFSALFLLSYIVYHLTTPETRYCHEGMIRILYFILLISHVVLAAIILPIILFTFLRAYTGQIELHRKMAKWAFPIWLYIAITGPVLYLMLRNCFE